MAHIRMTWLDQPPPEIVGGVVTVGNFDGVHRGHVALIQSAKQLGTPVVAVTFDQPPTAVLFPSSRKPQLTTNVERSRLLHQIGADHVVELKAEAGLLALSPEAFFEDVLCGIFSANAIVEGANIRFGRARSGSIETLQSLSQHAAIRLCVVPPVLDDHEQISSSRIRSAIQQGDVEPVSRWLGRNYAISGIVVKGAQRGRTLGFPTINFGDVQTLIPKVGVYSGTANCNGQRLAAAIHIGPNPSFGEQLLKIEAHLIEFHGDLYDQTVTIEFENRLRDIVRFSNIDELKSQLTKDVAQVRELHKA